MATGIGFTPGYVNTLARRTPLIDIDRNTGDYISGMPRVAQSINVILKTRIRTRIERRWWGSDFIDMMDKPQNQEVFAAGIFQACYYIDLYEPEFKVTKVSVSPSYDGTATIIVSGIYLPDQSQQDVTTRIYG